MRSLLVLVVLLFPTVALCAEDQITLRSGEVVHGKLTEKGLMSVTIETSKGKRSFPRGSVLKFGKKKNKETPTPKPTATAKPAVTATPKSTPVSRREPINPEKGPAYAKALRRCAGKTFTSGEEQDKVKALFFMAARTGSPEVRAVLKEYLDGSLKPPIRGGAPMSHRVFTIVYRKCLTRSADADGKAEYEAQRLFAIKAANDAAQAREDRAKELRDKTDDWVKGLNNDG